MAEKISFSQNRKLLDVILKKEGQDLRNKFLEILRATNNESCAKKIDPTVQPKNENLSPPYQQTFGLKHFENFEVINSGAFGLVMKAKHKETKIFFAIKITGQYFYREVDSLRLSRHQNIVRFVNSWMEHSDDDTKDLHDVFQDYDEMYCIQMELCNGRNLSSWILLSPSKKSEWDAKRICFQMAVGVESLHSKKIIHRDLKPANILLLNKYAIIGQEDLIVKIGDLGMSRATYQESKMSRKSLMTNGGTELYMSPEQELKLDRYDEKADIFPMGIIFYEVLNSTFEKTQVKPSIRQAILPRDFIDKFKVEARLIKRMLSKDPSSRPKAKEVIDELNTFWNTDEHQLKERKDDKKKKTTKLNDVTDLFRNGEWQNCIHALEESFTKRATKDNEELTKCLTILIDYWTRNEMSTALVDFNRNGTEMNDGTMLIYSYLRLGNKQEALKIAKQIVTDIGHLIQILRDTQVPNYEFEHYSNSADLKLDVKSKKIVFNRISLSLSSFDRISAEELTLFEVTFFRDSQELEQVKVNDFIDLSNIKQLTLECDEQKKNMSFDLSGDVSVSMDYLYLRNVRALKWSNCNWIVKKLQLRGVPFEEKSNVKVQQFTIWHSSLDISYLPHTIQKLHVWGKDVEAFVSEGVKLPNLKLLTLSEMDDVGCLTHLRSAPLTHIHLHFIKKMNLDLLPQTPPHLLIISNGEDSDDIPIVGSVRKVDKLILNYFSFEEVEECLTHFQTHDLVIYNHHGIEVKALVPLMKKQINSIAVGPIYWEEEDFKAYSSQLDSKADYYLLEEGRGKRLEEEEFDKLKEIF